VINKIKDNYLDQVHVHVSQKNSSAFGCLTFQFNAIYKLFLNKKKKK